MLSVFKREKANSRLKEIIKDYAAEYKQLSELSRSEYIAKLSPGTSVPYKVYLSPEYKEQFSDKCMNYRNEVHDIISGLCSDLEGEMTKAPDADAVNAITLLSLRSAITEDEVDLLLSKYGNNVQAYRTIKDIAANKGMKNFKDHAIEEEYKAIQGIGDSLERGLTVHGAEHGTSASDGMLSMWSYGIDEAIPAEE